MLSFTIHRHTKNSQHTPNSAAIEVNGKTPVCCVVLILYTSEWKSWLLHHKSVYRLENM